MTVDVHVRRATLTFRRRTGWSWGPAPDALVREALAALEATVAAAVAELDLPADADLTLPAPVTLRLGPGPGIDPAAVFRLAEDLRAQLRALAAEAPPATGPEPDRAVDPVDAVGLGTVDPDAAAARALAATLAGWSTAGLAAAVPATWPPATVRAWEDALARLADHVAPPGAADPDGASGVAGPRSAAGPGASAGAAAREVAPEVVERVVAAVVAGPGAALDAGVARLAVLAALTAMLDERLPGAHARERVRRAVAARAVPEASQLPGPSPAAPVAATGPDRAPRTATPAWAAAEVRALPLLVLAQLARVGYLDLAAVALDAAGLGRHLPAWGAALAAKALDPPERGWRRDPRAHATLVAAAGAAQSPGGAPRWADAVAPLVTGLAASYAAGRAGTDPLVHAAGEHGVLLAEPAGLLPVAWAPDDAGTAPVQALLGHPPVQPAEEPEPAAFAAAMEQRPGLVPPGPAAVERHLGLAVGTALGLLAAQLWAPAEPTSPLLALDRLGTLDGWAEPEPTGLLVRLPLGRRRRDLGRCGALADAAIPWLPGGVLRFGAW